MGSGLDFETSKMWPQTAVVEGENMVVVGCVTLVLMGETRVPRLGGGIAVDFDSTLRLAVTF